MLLEIARITDPSSVAFVSDSLLLRLMRERSPKLAKRVLAAGKKPSAAQLATHLETISTGDNADALLEDLHWIARMATTDSIEDLLIDQGVDLKKNTLGDALAIAALDNRAVFESVADHVTVVGASSGATFTLFRSKIASKFELSSGQCKSFEVACSSFFETLGQGSHCQVRWYAEHDETGFLIDHAGARRTERIINEDEKPEVRQFRPPRHDVVLLQRRTGRLRVLARSEKERIFYASAVGKLIAKSDNAFTADETYLLDAIASAGYEEVLRDMADTEIERVTLRELKFTNADDQSTRQLVTSSDVMRSIDVNSIDITSSTLQVASFAIVPRIRKRRRSFRITVWKGNKVRHTTPWTDKTIQEFIERLQLRRAND